MIWNSEQELESMYEHCLKERRVIRNLSDKEKIDYILIGIALGIGIGYVIAMWMVYYVQ